MPHSLYGPNSRILVNLSIWLLQVRLLSLSTPSDLAVVTCSIGAQLIDGLGGTVRVHSLCLDPMSINSVLVILSASLFAISQLLTLTKSSFRQDWIVSALKPA